VLLLGLTGWPLLAWSFGGWASFKVGLAPARSSRQQHHQADKEGNQRLMRARYASRGSNSQQHVGAACGCQIVILKEEGSTQSMMLWHVYDIAEAPACRGSSPAGRLLCLRGSSASTTSAASALGRLRLPLNAWRAAMADSACAHCTVLQPLEVFAAGL
jgi:hypothetical protein